MRTDRDIARWRLHSQHLAAPLDGAEAVVGSLLAVQAENPSQSAWAVATRTRAPVMADLAGLLASGRVLRTHVLRPTWHYVHADDALWLIELTRDRVLPTVDQQLVSLTDRMSALADAVLEILAESPDRTRAELADSLEERGHELTGMQLMLLAAHLELHALICSGVPRDGEHTYSLFPDRVGAPRTRPALLHIPWACHGARPRVLGDPHPRRRAPGTGRRLRPARIVRARRPHLLARPGHAPGIRISERSPAAGAG
jgi:hypothetical protein